MQTNTLTRTPVPSATSNGHLATTLAAANKLQSPGATVANQTLFLRLGDIGLDIRQPRRWMPVDLRTKVTAGKCNHAEAMHELLMRASKNDLEALGYISTIRLLAEDIAEVGLRTPIKVMAASPGTSSRYTVLHGERRTWACLYLAATQNLSLRATLATTIEAIVDTEATELPPEEIRRWQWSENLQREDVPLIDFACEAGQVYSAMYAHAELKRSESLALLDWQEDEQATSQIGLALAKQEIKRATGRAVQERTILLYASIAEKLGEPTKALARAYHLGARDLNQLAKLSGDEQLELAQQLVTANNIPTQIVKPQSKSSPTTDAGGRPNRAQHFINLLAKIPERVNKTTDRQLAELKPEQLQTMLHAANQTRELLDNYGKRIQVILQRPGLATQ
jgi:hypothetical protein